VEVKVNKRFKKNKIVYSLYKMTVVLCLAVYFFFYELSRRTKKERRRIFAFCTVLAFLICSIAPLWVTIPSFANSPTEYQEETETSEFVAEIDENAICDEVQYGDSFSEENLNENGTESEDDNVEDNHLSSDEETYIELDDNSQYQDGEQPNNEGDKIEETYSNLNDETVNHESEVSDDDDDETVNHESEVKDDGGDVGDLGEKAQNHNESVDNGGSNNAGSDTVNVAEPSEDSIIENAVGEELPDNNAGENIDPNGVYSSSEAFSQDSNGLNKETELTETDEAAHEEAVPVEIVYKYNGFDLNGEIYSGNEESSIVFKSNSQVAFSSSFGYFSLNEDSSWMWRADHECFEQLYIEIYNLDGKLINTICPYIAIDSTKVSIEVSREFDEDDIMTSKIDLVESGDICTGINDFRILLDGSPVENLSMCDAYVSENIFMQGVITSEHIEMSSIPTGIHNLTIYASDYAGNVSIYSQDIIVPAKLMIDKPNKVSLTIDPWNIAGKTTIYSEQFAIVNRSVCAVETLPLSVSCYINHDKNSELAEKYGISDEIKKDAILYLRIIETGEMFPIPECGIEIDLNRILNSNSTDANYITFEVFGEISEGSEWLWQSGDIKINLCFDFEFVYDETGEYSVNLLDAEYARQVLYENVEYNISEVSIIDEWTVETPSETLVDTFFDVLADKLSECKIDDEEEIADEDCENIADLNQGEDETEAETGFFQDAENDENESESDICYDLTNEKN